LFRLANRERSYLNVLGRISRVGQFNPLISFSWCNPSGTAIPPCGKSNYISDISEGGMAVPDRYYGSALRLRSGRSSLKTVHRTVLSPSATAPHSTKSATADFGHEAADKAAE
jgi:hypothetical protein